MKFYSHYLKRRALPVLGATIVYLGALLWFIHAKNADSVTFYPIQPYILASEVMDFFFPLFVSLPFSYSIFFLRKDHFLDYASMRERRSQYLARVFVINLVLCFLMVFFVNGIGIIYSTKVATLEPLRDGFGDPLRGYPFGKMQIEQPIYFGFLWSLYKALMGSVLCFFALTVALYIENMFLALCFPFLYVLLENFVTGTLGLSRYSFSTTFILNRLTPQAMSLKNIGLGVLLFLVEIGVVWLILRRRYERN